MTDDFNDPISRAARALPVDLEPERVEALIARVRRPAPVTNYRPRLVAAGLAAAFVLVWALVPRASVTLVPSGAVSFSGSPLLEPRKVALSETWSVEVGAHSTLELVASNSASIWLGESSRLTNSDGVRLERGSALVTSDTEQQLATPTENVAIAGVSLIVVEPEDAAVRVTDLLNQFPSGARMKNKWIGVAVGTIVVGTGVSVFALEGRATVAPSAGATPAVIVAAGEQWRSSGEAKGSVAPPRGPTALQPPGANVAAVVVGQLSRAQLEALSQPELVAMIEKLSAEKEALVKQNSALQKAMSPRPPPQANFYRMSADELATSAKNGEVKWRLPMGSEYKIDPKVAAAHRLSPDEVTKIKAVYSESDQRVHAGLIALYGEMGGDKDSVASFSSNTLLGVPMTQRLSARASAKVPVASKCALGTARCTACRSSSSKIRTCVRWPVAFRAAAQATRAWMRFARSRSSKAGVRAVVSRKSKLGAAGSIECPVGDPAGAPLGGLVRMR